MIPTLMVLPALRNKRNIVDIDRDAENINIARQRMQEIEPLKQQGEANIEEAQLELQAALLEDLLEHNAATASNTSLDASLGASLDTSTVAFKGWGMLIILLIPLLSLGLYSYLGSPQFALQTIDEVELTAQPGNEFDIDQLLARLEEKLAQDSDNPQGWELAARTYMTLGDYRRAESAYAKLNALALGNPDFLAAWADAEIMLSGNVYTPAAKDRIGKVLSLNPNHVNALWMASLGAESLGDHGRALVHLNTLLPLVMDDPQSVHQIERLIERNRNPGNAPDNINGDAQKRMPTDHAPKNPGNPEKPGKVITVEVMLADNLVAQTDKDDVVFVFSKALQGALMPLAASKHRVKDLPIEIEFTENGAMLPGMSIASFDAITVAARVSKTGKPVQQAGDLVSEPVLITTNNQKSTVKLIIDRIAE
ncbi:c-type cytochrome biogenesis protein CcmI [Candidatus Spongiihabitans sp.]|uniref:c-type cytochrome biogenesis protein CcmI n=1 Tax=Candidatus Spongiihabitans sp. TaxID=3101308 RepID=UPI003C7A586E